MFLLLGFRTRDTVAFRRWLLCEVCRIEAEQTVIKRSTRFTLFFVPLFPVKPSTYYVQCANCNAFRRTDSRAVAGLAS